MGMQLHEKYTEKFKRDTGSCIHAKEIFVIIGTTYTGTDSSIFLMCVLLPCRKLFSFLNTSICQTLYVNNKGNHGQNFISPPSQTETTQITVNSSLFPQYTFLFVENTKFTYLAKFSTCILHQINAILSSNILTIFAPMIIPASRTECLRIESFAK